MGTFVGQLLFGWLADLVGRKRMCMHLPLPPLRLGTEQTLLDGVELMIIIVGTFAQALSGSAHAVNILGVIIFWRVIMGKCYDRLHFICTDSYKVSASVEIIL